MRLSQAADKILEKVLEEAVALDGYHGAGLDFAEVWIRAEEVVVQLN